MAGQVACSHGEPWSSCNPCQNLAVHVPARHLSTSRFDCRATLRKLNGVTVVVPCVGGVQAAEAGWPNPFPLSPTFPPTHTHTSGPLKELHLPRPRRHCLSCLLRLLQGSVRRMRASWWGMMERWASAASHAARASPARRAMWRASRATASVQATCPMRMSMARNNALTPGWFLPLRD